MSQDTMEAAAEGMEYAAKICERLVVGGRAWTPEQAAAAETLFHAAKEIRAAAVAVRENGLSDDDVLTSEPLCKLCGQTEEDHVEAISLACEKYYDVCPAHGPDCDGHNKPSPQPVPLQKQVETLKERVGTLESQIEALQEKMDLYLEDK